MDRRSFLSPGGLAALASSVPVFGTAVNTAVRQFRSPLRVSFRVTTRTEASLRIAATAHDPLLEPDDPAVVSLSVRNVGTTRQFLRTSPPSPFGVLVLAREGRPVALLQTDAYDRSDDVQLGPFNRWASIAEIASKLPLSPDETVEEQYELHWSDELSPGAYDLQGFFGGDPPWSSFGTVELVITDD